MASDRHLPPPAGRARPRVAVVADQALVAESVRAALRGRGYDATVRRWPTLEDPRRIDRPLPRRPRRCSDASVDIGVLLSGLERIAQVHGAQAVIGSLAIPWVVLAGAPRGPVWGALYECGDAVVVPDETGLDAVCALLEELHQGSCADPIAQHELVRSWRAFAQHRLDQTVRLQSLSSREEEVLELLHRGFEVRSIARRDDVTEATVRSQVKAILRKLDVSSQIAAVASYQEVRSNAAGRGAHTLGRRAAADG